MRKIRGFSIIEMMIVSLLGMMISFVIMRIMISTNNTMGVSDAQAQTMESGRFALNYISRFVRQAGYFEHGDNEAAIILYPALESSSNTGDTLVLVTDPHQDQQRSCNNITNLIGNKDIIYNIFSVSDNALKCRAFNQSTGIDIGADTEIVRGIEAMHVLYGISEDTVSTNSLNSSSPVIEYVSSDRVGNRQVRSVKVALLAVSTDDASKLNQDKESFILLDSDVYEREDNKTRQIFSTTIGLNNYSNEIGL